MTTNTPVSRWLWEGWPVEQLTQLAVDRGVLLSVTDVTDYDAVVAALRTHGDGLKARLADDFPLKTWLQSHANFREFADDVVNKASGVLLFPICCIGRSSRTSPVTSPTPSGLLGDFLWRVRTVCIGGRVAHDLSSMGTGWRRDLDCWCLPALRRDVRLNVHRYGRCFTILTDERVTGRAG